MPEIFVEELHAKGLIFSDPRGNCVFARDQDSGVFKVGTSDKPFIHSLGKGGQPFVMPGTDNKAFVADYPLDALSLKLMHPDSTILATGGYMAVDKLKPYLHLKEIFLAPSQEKIGQQMAKHLSDNFPTASRIQPGQAESWNEYRLLQLKDAKEKKEQEAKQAQAATKTRAETFVPTTNTNRSSGLRR